MHSESDTGLVPASEVKNKGHEWLLESYNDLTRRVLDAVIGCEFGLRLGGDLVDSPGRDARNMAYELLRPFVNRADKNIYGVPGTEYHVADDGEEDRSIYDLCGATCKQYHALEIAGQKVAWAHHLLKVGGTPWTELNGFKQAAESMYFCSLQYGTKSPTLAVGHHVHRVPQGAPVVWRGITVTTVGCWKLPDSFSAKVAPGKLPTIGAMLYWPQEHRVQHITYDIPPEIAYS